VHKSWWLIYSQFMMHGQKTSSCKKLITTIGEVAKDRASLRTWNHWNLTVQSVLRDINFFCLDTYDEITQGGLCDAAHAHFTEAILFLRNVIKFRGTTRGNKFFIYAQRKVRPSPALSSTSYKPRAALSSHILTKFRTESKNRSRK